jgi:hypothetical protein
MFRNDPPAIVREAVDLKAMVQQANDEIRIGEANMRVGAEHFRKAGELLLKLKKEVGHGAWTHFAKQNLQAPLRTLQRYMRLAKAPPVALLEEQWAIICGKSGGEQEEADTPPGPAVEPAWEPYVASGPTPVPAAISSLAESGLLDTESVAFLLKIRDDYGDEIVWQCDRAVLEDDARKDATDVFLALNAIRPLDQPTLWPLWPLEDVPADLAVQKAIAVLYQDEIRRGCKIPWWEITAFWFAAQVVRVSSRLQDPMPRGQLARDHVAVWRESFRTALAWFVTGGFDGKYTECPKYATDPEGFHSWFGYRSDLRHAGVISAAEILRTADRGGPSEWAAVRSRFPGLWSSYLSCLYDLDATGTYPLPSCMQGRLDRFIEDSPDEESECEVESEEEAPPSSSEP